MEPVSLNVDRVAAQSYRAMGQGEQPGIGTAAGPAAGAAKN